MASPIVRIDTRSGDFSIGSILQTDAGQTQIEPVDMHIQAKEDPYRYHNSTNRAWTRCKVDFSKKKKYKMTRSQLSHKEYKRHKHNSLIPAIINAFSYISKTEAMAFPSMITTRLSQTVLSPVHQSFPQTVDREIRSFVSNKIKHSKNENIG